MPWLPENPLIIKYFKAVLEFFYHYALTCTLNVLKPELEVYLLQDGDEYVQESILVFFLFAAFGHLKVDTTGFRRSRQKID